MHLDPVRVRRAPLALVLLWLNHILQADGLRTWWLQGGSRAAIKAPEQVRTDLFALRAEADNFGPEWQD